MDQLTLDRIETAHPLYRVALRKLYLKANNKLGKYVRLRFSWVYRTPEEQHKMFIQIPNISNADAWQSLHNYGLAFDIVLLLDKDKNGTFEVATWDTIKDFDLDGVPDWMEVVEVFKADGWEWGGDWKGKFKDKPHFQKTLGYTWRSLKKLIDSGKTIIDNGRIYPKI